MYHVSVDTVIGVGVKSCTCSSWKLSCYALEGAYPSSVQYLEDNYGLTYDKDKYAIGYVAIGSNIMPDMQIIELGVEEDVSE